MPRAAPVWDFLFGSACASRSGAPGADESRQNRRRIEHLEPSSNRRDSFRQSSRCARDAGRSPGARHLQDAERREQFSSASFFFGVPLTSITGTRGPRRQCARGRCRRSASPRSGSGRRSDCDQHQFALDWLVSLRSTTLITSISLPSCLMMLLENPVVAGQATVDARDVGSWSCRGERFDVITAAGEHPVMRASTPGCSRTATDLCGCITAPRRRC